MAKTTFASYIIKRQELRTKERKIIWSYLLSL